MFTSRSSSTKWPYQHRGAAGGCGHSSHHLATLDALTTGKSVRFIRSDRKRCQAPSAKIFSFRFSEFCDCIAPSRLHQEGRIAIATDVGSGERWTRQCRKASGTEADERSRAVLISRRWDQARRVTNLRATEAKELGTPGRPRISRKPSRRERRIVAAALSLLACAKCTLFARKARGCGQHPAFPAPSDFRGRHFLATPRARSRCGKALLRPASNA
jgi:hypothetical protein